MSSLKTIYSAVTILVLLSSIMLASKTAYGDIANCVFSVDGFSGEAPLTVTFYYIQVLATGSDYNSGSVTFTLWVDGEPFEHATVPVQGPTADAPDMPFTFYEPGTYDVQFECAHSSGASAYSRIETINVSSQNGDDFPTEEFDFEISVETGNVNGMQGDTLTFDVVATILNGEPGLVYIEIYLINDQGQASHVQAWDEQVTPTGTVPYEIMTSCDDFPGVYEFEIRAYSESQQEIKTAKVTTFLLENPDCAPANECGELTITPTLPPASDPRNMASPTDTASYRLQVVWSGTVPVRINFDVQGGDGVTIIPQFAFNPANMLSSPISVLMNVDARHAAEGEYPLTIDAWVIDPDTGQECHAEDPAQVVLVVSAQSRPIALPLIGKVDNPHGDAVIIDDNGEMPAEDQEIRPGVKIETGIDGNVEISSEDGKAKLGRQTTIGIADIEPSPDGDLETILPIDWKPDIEYPPVDDNKFWKNLGSELVDFHKELAGQAIDAAKACLLEDRSVGKYVALFDCLHQGIYLLYNGYAHFSGDPKVEPLTVLPSHGHLWITPTAAILPEATEFSLEVAPDGTTTLTTLEGPVWVMDLKSRNSVLVGSNEQIVIKNTSDGMGEDELMQSITKFNPAKLNTWWLTSVKEQFQVGDFATAKALENDSPYRPVSRTAAFSDQDELVYAWIQFVNVLPSEHTIDFKWYRPDGALYFNEIETIQDAGQGRSWQSYSVWSVLDVKDNAAASKPGLWNVDIYADGNLVKQLSFNMTQTVTPSECLIATAAFGSDLAPQVQFLRHFRDDRILSTAAGSSFLTVFNTWYYSFSPYVAEYERQQPLLQQTVKTSIYPLLGILQLSEKAYTAVPGEYGALSAGMVASVLIGSVYFAPVALSIRKVRVLGPGFYRIAIAVAAAACIAVVTAIEIGNPTAMMITTPLFVLSLLSLTALLMAKMYAKIAKRIRYH